MEEKRGRGRPKLDEKNKKKFRAVFRVTDKTYEKLKLIAEKRGITISALVREMIIEGIEREKAGLS